MDWAKKAACLGMNPEIFYPDSDEIHSKVTKLALSICQGCPVRAECLTHAVNNDESFGIWGGLSLRSRRKLTKKYGEQITVDYARLILERI